MSITSNWLLNFRQFFERINIGPKVNYEDHTSTTVIMDNIIRLLNLYKDSGLNLSSHYTEYDDKIKAMLNNQQHDIYNIPSDYLRGINLKDLVKQPEYQQEIFSLTKTEQFHFQLGLDNFLRVIKSLFQKFEPAFWEFNS